MRSEQKRILIQIGLFILTFITTTIAGAQWAGRSLFAVLPDKSIGLNPDFSWADFEAGLTFSVPLITILTAHEFGHYFMAIYHKVKTSLPYYLPFPPIPLLPFSIGTMGAVIRLRTRPETNLQTFDIGLAGPIAGFVFTLAFLFYGFYTLPPAEHIYTFHPEYKQYGLDYDQHVYTPEYINANPGSFDVKVGSTLLFWIFEQFVDDPKRVPNVHEIMHYPVLLACYFALFVTCLNLLPIGQLDGGHVTYGLFGYKKHRVIATIFFIAMIFYSGLGLPFLSMAYFYKYFSIPGLNLSIPYLFISVPLYFYFLLMCFKGLGLSRKNTLMYTTLMFAAHFILVQYAPQIKGYAAWLLFVFILGRFVGVRHPASDIEQPLDSTRILLGWITLLIFALCFSPAILVITSAE
jgi:membrane-associated protease RseP (regulator of RpoE activity)